MPKLEDFYNNRVAETEYDDFLKQVGHTVQGQPISKEDFEELIGDIVTGLDLNAEDSMFEAGCGNGLITKVLSDKCDKIVAVDLSEKLIDVAKDLNSAANIEYHCSNFLEFNDRSLEGQKFDKFLMFAALQHFNPKLFSRILERIENIMNDEFVIFFGFVLDKKFKWNFHHGIARKTKYFLRKLMRTDIMGFWWEEEYIKRISQKHNMKCEIVRLKEDQYGSPYRFHIKLTK